MPDAPAPPEPAVVVPVGLPILEAAAWVGHVCWAELRFHETLTRWSGLEADPTIATTVWIVRSHRAELAEAWHRRLPELSELPGEQFVRSSKVADAGFDRLDALTAPGDGLARSAALADALAQMLDHYEAHVAVAVGPADGPVADTLATAITRTRADLSLLRSAV